MARIRSIHPGFFTDEDLVGVSMAARLLFLGIGVEADDKGVFEWKPLTLKMRIFPADNLDVGELLTELVAAGSIMAFEIGGRPYGAIRNFRKYQKPKTPNDIHPASPEILRFVGLSSEMEAGDDASFPPNGETFPQNGEIARQMEEGGWRMEEEEGGDTPFNPPEGKKAGYAFRGKVARLNRKDYADAKRRFHAIPDFDAELAAFDSWLSTQTDAKKKNWFGSFGPWLNRRHQEAIERASPVAAKSASFSGPC